MSVKNHIKRVKVYEKHFARYYGLNINHNQCKGTAWDCAIPNSEEKIEFKADFMAAKTGNHFVEFEYSSTEGDSWDESGITLAKVQSDYWAVYYGRYPEDYHWYRPGDIVGLISKLNSPVKGIRRNLYGNSGTVRCNGFIIPLEEMKKIEIDAPISPVEPNVVDLF